MYIPEPASSGNSSFSIRYRSSNGNGATTYGQVRIHYYDSTNGVEIARTQTSDVNFSFSGNTNNTSYTFANYAGQINGYTYKNEARYRS